MRSLLAIFIITAAVCLGQEEDADQLKLLGDAYLKVQTLDGPVKGKLESSCRMGTSFAAFRGIPYAVPPIGSLRFKAPVPKGKWTEVWDATTQRAMCVQSELEFPGSAANQSFSEDCLYLNVYTPNVRYLKWKLGVQLKAVMVFIHPGAFSMGSSTENILSPDFLIDQDVVVVTFNYRLGALGFLSLQNADVPGNAGLKDQTLALKWVKNNIRSFGGDPNKITIFGESAGSASVHYHLLSKSSEGLFSAAIMQSGTALTPWGYSPPDISLKKALRLSKAVGCTQKNSEELLACLQKVPAEAITDSQQGALTLEELLTLRIIAFHPTSEPPVPGAFITGDPFDLMAAGNFTKVPSIVGSTSHEGLLVYPTLMGMDPNGYLITLLGMDLSRFVPYGLHVHPLTKQAVYAHQEISRFYFNRRFVTVSMISDVLQLVTDVMFTIPTQMTARYLADASVPVYNYLFTYDGGYNILKQAAGMKNISGACHGDDLGYLFYTPDLHTQCGANLSGPDELNLERMTTMWANFAKTGKPSLEKGSKITWKPFTAQETAYLTIGNDLVPSEGLKLANMVFWKELETKILDMKTGPREMIDLLDHPEF